MAQFTVVGFQFALVYVAGMPELWVIASATSSDHSRRTKCRANSVCEFGSQVPL